MVVESDPSSRRNRHAGSVKSAPAGPGAPRDQAEARRVDHVVACRRLIHALEGDKNTTLAGLLFLLKRNGKCLDCGTEKIEHLVIDKNASLPVPVFDVRAGPRARWDGIHLLFGMPGTPETRWGHLIARNLDGPFGSGFPLEEELKRVCQHEHFHVEESLSGAAYDLMTRADIDFAHGFAELLPTFAAQGFLSRDEAFCMARRFYLQHMKRELGACSAVDYPYYRGKVGNGDGRLENYRGALMCMIVGFPLEPLGVGFVDAYSIDWREWTEAVRSPMEQLARGTFLEEPVLFRETAVTPWSLLASIDVSRGCIRDTSGGKMPFPHLVSHLQRDGGVATYGLHML